MVCSVNLLPQAMKCFVGAFGEYSFSWTMVFEWHSHFKAVDDDKYSGQPSTSRATEYVENVRELIHEDSR
jgi:hypothetical protein